KFLQTAVHVSKRAQIRDYIERKATGPSGLHQRNQAYESDILAIADRVVQDLAADTNLTAARDREQALSDEYDDLVERRAAHMIAAGDPNNHEAELVATLEAVDGAIDGTTYFNVGGVAEVPLNLDGSHASWTEGATNIDQFAASAAIALNADQLLSLNVTGTWAPKCSLEAVQVLTPDGSSMGPITFPSDGSVPAPQTGPEGYGLRFVGGAQQAYNHADTDATTETSSVSFQSCVSAGGPLGAGLGMSAQACTGWNYSQSHSTSESTTHGHDARLSATFSGGIRLANTPFPAAPAGSLLVVELPRGTTRLDDIRDIHLVRTGNTSVRVAADSDLYLVVNDRSCAGQDTLHRLTLRGARLASADDIARDLMARIAQVLSDVAGYRAQLGDAGHQVAGDVVGAGQSRSAQGQPVQSVLACARPVIDD
ncbi:MAG: hypothetical protein AAGC55_30110, partial [Myxococcota bacterium]